MPYNDSAANSSTSVSTRVDRPRAGGDHHQDHEGRDDANTYGGASGCESAGEVDFSPCKEDVKPIDGRPVDCQDVHVVVSNASKVEETPAAESSGAKEMKRDPHIAQPQSKSPRNPNRSWRQRRKQNFGASAVDAIKKRIQNDESRQQAGGAVYEADTQEPAADRRNAAAAAAANSPATANLNSMAAHAGSMRHSASLPMFRDTAASGAAGGVEPCSEAPRQVVHAPVQAKSIFQYNASQVRPVPLRASYVSAATTTREFAGRGASPLKATSPQVRFLPKSASCVALPQHLHSLRGATGLDSAMYISSHIPLTPQSYAGGGGTGSFMGTPLMMNSSMGLGGGSAMGRNGRMASASVASSMQMSTPLPTAYAIGSIVDIAPFYEYAIQQIILECEHRNTRGNFRFSGRDRASTTAPGLATAAGYWQSSPDASAMSPVSQGLGGSVALPRDATPVSGMSGVRRALQGRSDDLTGIQKGLQKSYSSASRAEDSASGVGRMMLSSATSPVCRGSVVSTHSFDTPIQTMQLPMQVSLSSPIFFSPTSCGSLSLSTAANIAPATNLKEASRTNTVASDSTPSYVRAIPQRSTQQQQQPGLYSMDRTFMPEKAGSTSRTGSALGMPFAELESVASVQRLIENLAHRIPYGPAAPIVFIAALIYLSRITLHGDATDDTMLTALNWPRLTTIAVLVASKMYIDQVHKLNKKFAEAQGMSVASVCKLELDFLYLIDFDLCIEEEEIERCADWMESIAIRRNMVTPLKMFIMGKPSSVMTTPQTSHQPLFSRSGSVHGLSNQMFSLQHHIGNPEGTPSTPFSWSMATLPLEAGLASPGTNNRPNRAPSNVINHPKPYVRQPNQFTGTAAGRELRDSQINLADADGFDSDDERDCSRTRFANSGGRNQQHYDPATNNAMDAAPVSAATASLSPFPAASMLPNCNFGMPDIQRSGAGTPSTLSPPAAAAPGSTAQSTPIVLIRGWQQHVQQGVSLATSTSENGTDQCPQPAQPQRATPCAHPISFTPPSAGASHTPITGISGTLPHVPVVPPLQSTPLLQGRHADSFSYGQLPLSTALGQASWNASPIAPSPLQLRFPLYAANETHTCVHHRRHPHRGNEKEHRNGGGSSGDSDSDSVLSESSSSPPSECSCEDVCGKRKRLFIIVHAPKEPDTPDSMRGRRGPAPPDLSPLRPPSRGDSPPSFFFKAPVMRRKPQGMEGCSSASSATGVYVPAMPVLQRPHMSAVDSINQDRLPATTTGAATAVGTTSAQTQHGQDSSSSAARCISSQSSASSKTGQRLPMRPAVHGSASHRALDRLVGNRLRGAEESETSVKSSNHSAVDETDNDRRICISRGLGADVNPRRGSSANESEAGKREEERPAKREDDDGPSVPRDSSDSSPASNGSDERLHNGTAASDASGRKDRQITDCGDEQDDAVSANRTNNKGLKLPVTSTILSPSSSTSFRESSFQATTASSTGHNSPPGGGLSTDPSSSTRTHSSVRHTSWKMDSDALSQQSKNTSADTTINDMSALAKRHAEVDSHKDTKDATGSTHFCGGASDSEYGEGEHSEGEGAANHEGEQPAAAEERDKDATESNSTTRSTVHATTHEMYASSSDTGTLPSMLDRRSVGTAPGKTSACGSADFSSGGAANAPRNQSEVLSVLAELRMMNRERCSNPSESSHPPAPPVSAPVALAPIEVEPMAPAAAEAIQCESPVSPSTAGNPDAELSSSNKSRWNFRASLGGMTVVRQVRDVLGATTSLVRGPLNVFSSGNEAPEPPLSHNLRKSRVSYDELSYSSVDSSNYYTRMPGYPAPPSPLSPPTSMLRRNISAYATTQACSMDEDYYGNGHRDSFFSNGSYDMCSMDYAQGSAHGEFRMPSTAAGAAGAGAGAAAAVDDASPCGGAYSRPAVGGTDTEGRFELCESMRDDEIMDVDFEEAPHVAHNRGIPYERSQGNLPSQLSAHSNHAELKAPPPNFNFPEDGWVDVSANMSCRSLEEKDDYDDDDDDDDIPEVAIGVDAESDRAAENYYYKCRPTHSPPSL